MIKIENVETFGWEAAIRGMRNPMNSWEKSDSVKCYANANCPGICKNNVSGICIGFNDFDLMTRLRNAGTDHRKFMRMITVYVDITAPLYWWKEFDTYKVGTVANSCSTMHKIHAKEFTLEDFSCEHIGDVSNCDPMYYAALEGVIMALNEARHCFLDTKDKKYWWQMIQLLPSSYNQRRTVMLNYEVLANIYKSRRNHKLNEWVKFCAWIKTLPYSKLITEESKDKNETESEED
nr:MAG TPA: hypothetical protein [Caudoviricetes sp.]